MKKKIVLAWILIFAMILSSLPAMAAAETAVSRSFVIETVEGSDVTLTKGTDKTFAARAGTRLASGYTLTTGRASYAGLKLDDNSNINLDASTKIDVSKNSGKELKLTVLSGSIMVNAGKQEPDRKTTFTAGNSTMGLRGTLFNLSYLGGVVCIVVLEGELDVTTTDGDFTLKAGQALEHPKQPASDLAGNYPLDNINSFDKEQLESFTNEQIEKNTWTDIYPLDLDELDSFTLKAIRDNIEMLI